MSDRVKLLNSYMDLNRAAKFYFLDPKGETHKIFLSHALGILKDVNNKSVKRFRKKLLEIRRKLKVDLGKEERIRIADEILTIGLLLKPQINLKTYPHSLKASDESIHSMN